MKPEGAGIYAQNADGKLALIGVSVDETDADGTCQRGKTDGRPYQAGGTVTANENFKILEDGWVVDNSKYGMTFLYQLFQLALIQQ